MPAADALPRLQVLLAALLFSTGGAAIKACSLDGWAVASLRSGIAALVVLLLLPAARRGLSPRILPVGLAYAATLVLFATATKQTTAANAIFLQSTAPFWILVLAPRLLGERFRPRDLAVLALAAAGLSLLLLGTAPPSASAPRPLLGNALALAAGLAWAFTVMGLRALERSGPGRAPAAVAAGNLLAFALALPFAWPLPPPQPADLAALLYLGVVQVALAYVFLGRGLARVPALEASLLLLAEPVLNPLWTWLLQGEHPGALPLAGGAVVLLASTAKGILDARNPTAGPP